MKYGCVISVTKPVIRVTWDGNYLPDFSKMTPAEVTAKAERKVVYERQCRTARELLVNRLIEKYRLSEYERLERQAYVEMPRKLKKKWGRFGLSAREINKYFDNNL